MLNSYTAYYVDDNGEEVQLAEVLKGTSARSVKLYLRNEYGFPLDRIRVVKDKSQKQPTFGVL